jgi:methylenetetrahydrofolate--tRNA-(uracil-5-)-methyltransferase
VDRDLFAAEVTRVMEAEPLIEIRREEAVDLDAEKIWIIASGPLTSDALAASIARLSGSEQLFFYDSISPIVEAESIDLSIAFRASRYGKSLDGTDDYVNCPFDKPQYEAFLDALVGASSVPAHIEADHCRYFEACLPIEEIARRGRDTLRFGPMKPMGLTDPRTGRRPYAVVQLRAENVRAGSYNLVGFQNHMRFAEQQRVLRMIPGLERAEFLRFGQVHRNTYINAPSLLDAALTLRGSPKISFAGQISGVEGYVESIATGLVAGRNAALLALGRPVEVFPRATAIGSLCAYVSGADAKGYQPANITFDLLPKLENPPKDRKVRQTEVCARALAALEEFGCARV